MPRSTLRSILLASALACGAALSLALPGFAAQSSVEDCPLGPLTLPLFGGTPAAIIAATPVVASNALLGAVSPEVGDAVIGQAVEDIVACINTGDPALQYAIFTERYLAERFADPSVAYQPRFEFELSLGPGDGVASFELVGVTDITSIEDGFVSVTVELAAGNARYRDTLILAHVDGVWLIDAIGELDPAP